MYQFYFSAIIFVLFSCLFIFNAQLLSWHMILCSLCSKRKVTSRLIINWDFFVWFVSNWKLILSTYAIHEACSNLFTSHWSIILCCDLFLFSKSRLLVEGIRWLCLAIIFHNPDLELISPFVRYKFFRFIIKKVSFDSSLLTPFSFLSYVIWYLFFLVTWSCFPFSLTWYSFCVYD